MRLDFTTKEKLKKRFTFIERAADTWLASFKSLKTYVNQTRGRFNEIPNSGKMIDHQVILDGHATQDLRILASGMQSGMTSPTRPWFELAIDDDYLMKDRQVRMWLDEVAAIMFRIIGDSNVYGTFYSMYEELGQFGTAASAFLEDDEKVIRGRPFTCGEYFLKVNEKGIVDGFARKFMMTVDNMVRMFRKENCSIQVQQKYDNGQTEDYIKVFHLIEPNDKRIPGQLGFKNMPFRSVYWESNNEEEVLSIGGFEEFPVVAPRWDTVTTEQVYGYGPGWYALGNIKQLQKTILDKLNAKEKSHNPPMQRDASVEGQANLLPGGVTATSSTLPNGGLRPAYQINAQLESFIELINELKASIDKDFFVNLFFMMVNFDKSNMTATEVAERQQEKVMMMGPVLEKLQSEMLDPFLERLFGILQRNYLIPEPPDALSGMTIKPVYISILAQAQKAIGVNSISRVIGFINGVLPLKQDAADVYDIDEAIREVALMEGTPAKLIREIETVQQIRKNRAEAQAQQEQMEVATKSAEAAKKLSQAKLDDNNVLSQVAGA